WPDEAAFTAYLRIEAAAFDPIRFVLRPEKTGTAAGMAGYLDIHPKDGIPRLAENPKNPLAKRRGSDSTVGMIRSGYLDSESRKDLIELARDGSVPHRLARRANALVLLDDGMSCEAVASVLLLDDDTVRTWYRLYEEEGIEGLASFGYEGTAC